MRIGLFGNMNNNFFGLVRYLRDRGYEAELYYPADADHFLPHCDDYTLDYQSYCHELNWNPATFYKTSPREILSLTRQFDAVIVCGYAAAFFNKVGRGADIYVPYGSDIYKYSHIDQHFKLRSRLRNIAQRLLKTSTPLDMSAGTVHRHLREGIRGAAHIILATHNPEFEAMFDSLNVKGTRHRCSIPFVYTPQYTSDGLAKYRCRTHWHAEFDRLRSEFDIVIFHHARHLWASRINPYTYKGNHRLLRGFAKFLKQRPSIRAALVTLDYGPDVVASKSLIRELGIDRSVRWFPKMYRKDLMVGLAAADVATGEFERSYLIFGTLMEAMTAGKPLLHHRQDSLYASQFPELYPLINAREPDEIAEALERYAETPSEHARMGAASRAWFLEHGVDAPLALLDRLLKRNGEVSEASRTAVLASSL